MKDIQAKEEREGEDKWEIGEMDGGRNLIILCNRNSGEAHGQPLLKPGTLYMKRTAHVRWLIY